MNKIEVERAAETVSRKADMTTSQQLLSHAREIQKRASKIHPANHLIAAISDDGELITDEMAGTGNSFIGFVTIEVPANSKLAVIEHLIAREFTYTSVLL